MSDKSRYMDFLPALFQEKPFLGKFLLPFEHTLDEISGILDHIARYFDPYLTDKEILPWLGTWVALVLDPEWEESKRRELIAKAVDLYRRRGTVAGLKQYLKIYTGLEPDIREWHWPGGMQIGIASRIGGLSYPGAPADAVINDLSPIASVMRYQPVYRDYYVIEMLDEAAHPATIYYPADPEVIRHVDRGVENPGQPDEHYYVEITHATEGVLRFSPATVTRRDHLIDDVYPIVGQSGVVAEFSGDTFLIDELANEDFLPYHFIVDVKVPPSERDKVKMDKVRAIVDLEKPAHTLYYLKLTYVESSYMFEPMQIEVRSDIGINTIIG